MTDSIRADNITLLYELTEDWPKVLQTPRSEQNDQANGTHTTIDEIQQLHELTDDSPNVVQTPRSEEMPKQMVHIR